MGLFTVNQNCTVKMVEFTSNTNVPDDSTIFSANTLRVMRRPVGTGSYEPIGTFTLMTSGKDIKGIKFNDNLEVTTDYEYSLEGLATVKFNMNIADPNTAFINDKPILTKTRGGYWTLVGKWTVTI